jgi:ABC-type branched-subunit amino acid transport system substrate-binding protein
MFGAAITGVLDVYFSTLNESGGIYDRRVELVVAERTSDLDTTLENLRRLIEDDTVFAVVGGFAAGMEQEIFDLLEENGVPNLGPITLMPVPAGIDDGSAFLTTASVAEQAQALVAHLADVSNESLGPVAILHSSLTNIETVAQAVARESKAQGLSEPFELAIGSGKGVVEQAVAELSRSEVLAVIYLGADELLSAFAKQAARTSWRPIFLLSGPLNARAAIDLPLEFNGKVFAAYPTLPSDRSSSGIEELERLQKTSGLRRDHLATQISALAAAKILVEGLRRSGRALSREKLVESLESLSKFDTGLMPAISYGPAKRVGASGAYVIEVDLEQRSFAAAPVWHDVD